MYFHDFGEGKMYDAARFVMAKYSLEYHAAVLKIEADIPHMQKTEAVKEVVLENQFDFIPADFTESKEYWASYKIPIEIAAKFSFLAKSVYKNETFYARSTKTNPIFVYKFTSGHMKLYRPLAERDKK